MSNSKILFITTASISTNPRLLKSYLYWKDKGFYCQIIAFRINNWADELDDQLILKYELNITTIPAAKQNFLFWLKATILHRILSHFKPKYLKVRYLSYASNKRSWQIIRYLKTGVFSFDHIEAHTLGALYPAFYWAKKQQITFSFDIEDYHPGEAIGQYEINEKQRRIFLMRLILPYANHFTFASPLIGKHSVELLDGLKIPKHILVNNCFSQFEFQLKQNNSKKIKFVWFSQNIAAGRGLEDILPVLNEFTEKVELHLIGNLYHSFYDEFLVEYEKFIVFHEPKPQNELNLELAFFDVGLALELQSNDFNRQICITNKIWAYLQSGLHIFATNTLAQKQFIETHMNAGLIVDFDSNSMREGLVYIIDNIESIRTQKAQRFEYAKQFSWEKESEKLLKISSLIPQ